MSNATLVIFPRGQLDSKQRERLTKSGIVAVEADDPKAVCILEQPLRLSCEGLKGDFIVKAALQALAAGEHGSLPSPADRQRLVFIKALNERMS